MEALQLMPDAKGVEKKTGDAITQANFLVVANHEQEQAAIDLARVIKDLKKEVDNTFDGAIGRAHEAHKAILAAKKKHYEPLDNAERIIKSKVIAFQTEQERLRREEQARLEELARKEQQKRIDAAAKKVNSLLEKSGDINEQIKALEDELSGADLLSEEDKAAIEHRLNLLKAKRDNIEQQIISKQAEAERVQYVPPVVPVAPAAPKVQGASTRVKKKAEVIDPMLLIKAVANGQVPVGVITFNMSALDKLVNAGAIVSGVKTIDDRILSVR